MARWGVLALGMTTAGLVVDLRPLHMLPVSLYHPHHVQPLIQTQLVE